MIDFIIERQNELRMVCFVAIFLIMFFWEVLEPARNSILARKHRWFANIGLLIVSSFLIKILVPLGLGGISIWANQNNWGLFNLLELYWLIEFLICLIVLDLIIYWQHRIFHQSELLWCFHKVHHADSHVDITTGIRFHPIEIVLSFAIKSIAIVIFGVPILAVICFEIILNALSMFNHANVRLPKTIEAIISKLLITQKLHRIHHSQVEKETNSNFGFSVVFWDKLFASYRSQAQLSDETLLIGLKDIAPTKKNASFRHVILLPFTSKNK